VPAGDADAGRAESSPMLHVEPLAGRLVAAAGAWRVDDAGRLDA
jgi:hypothetical protein